MKKSFAPIFALISVVILCFAGCSDDSIKLSFFDTDTKSLLNDVSDKIDEKIQGFTLFTKTDANVYVYITRVNNVYLTLYIAENYNGLDVSLAYQDMNDETISTFGALCGAVISTLDPLADVEELVSTLNMNSYDLNAAYSYKSENISYEYTVTDTAIYFSMYRD